jgi:hypothetical protein
MDGWTEYLNPTRCPWPCGFVTIASIIIIVGAIYKVVSGFTSKGGRIRNK